MAVTLTRCRHGWQFHGSLSYVNFSCLVLFTYWLDFARLCKNNFRNIQWVVKRNDFRKEYPIRLLHAPIPKACIINHYMYVLSRALASYNQYPWNHSRCNMSDKQLQLAEAGLIVFVVNKALLTICRSICAPVRPVSWRPAANRGQGHSLGRRLPRPFSESPPNDNAVIDWQAGRQKTHSLYLRRQR